MTTTTRNFTSPVGRLVGGNIFQSNDKDFDGRPLTTRENEPRVEYVVLIAFPKTDADTDKMRAEIYAAAVEGFPALFPQGVSGACTLPSFSFKWTDGDDTRPNQKGTKPCEKEGYPGCWVLTFKSSFAPKVYGQNQEPIADEKAIKRGDWVRVGVSCRGNGYAQNPGVYLNHSMLQLCGFGAEIASGPDVATVFADPIRLPAGVSATPIAPTGAVPGAAPPAVPGGVPAAVPGAGVPAAPVAPVAPAAPVAPTGAVPAPAGLPAPAPVPGFGAAVAPVVAPVAPAPPLAAPVAPAPPAAKQTVLGCPHTYEALVAGGWTEENMRAAGFLA